MAKAAEETETKEVKVKGIVYGEKINSGSIEELDCLIRAQIPLIQVITHEEDRFIDELYKFVCTPRKKVLYTWSGYRGLIKYEPATNNITPPVRASKEHDQTWNPIKGLQEIEKLKYDDKTESGIVIVMKDMHTFLNGPIPRHLRDMYSYLTFDKKNIIILGGQLAHGPGGQTRGCEPTLEKQIIVTNYTLPTREKIEEHIRTYLAGDASTNTKLKLEYTDQEHYEISRALQGLTYIEIDNAISLSFVHLKKLDVVKLLNEKKQIITRSGILEYIESNNSFETIGGMDGAKEFFRHHANSHSKEAEEFGVEPLKGALFVGIPGSGKSTFAKAAGNLWGLPTLRLDIGKVMSGLVGSSEQKMREVIATAEGVAPAVLWIDEVEKSLSGTKSSNHSDGGTLARVFGTLLTAMEEGLKGVVIIATANDISALPPELVRRFSEVFFVDLPVDSEREECFKIHLTKRKRDAKKFDLKALVKATDRYTGAEIEKAIKEAIAQCFTDKKRELTTEDLLHAIGETKPIATVMSEKINHMRDWARDRARFASSLAAEAAGKHIVKTKTGELDVNKSLDDLPEVGKPKKEKAKGRLSKLDSSDDEE